MSGVPRNGTSSTTQVSSARSPGGAGWIANVEVTGAAGLHRAASVWTAGLGITALLQLQKVEPQRPRYL